MLAILTVANNYLVVLLYTTLTPPVCRYDPLVRLRLTPSSHRWLAGGAPTHSVTDTVPPLSKKGGLSITGFLRTLSRLLRWRQLPLRKGALMICLHPAGNLDAKDVKSMLKHIGYLL